MTLIPPAEEIRNKLQNAPGNVRSFITSAEFTTAFENVRTTHKLHFDEAEKMGDSLSAVFLEMVPANQFPDLLKESLEQNSGAYGVVLADINEKIFKPFRKSLEGGAATPADMPVALAPAARPAQDIKDRPSPTPAEPLVGKKTDERPQTFSVDAFSEDEVKAEPTKLPKYHGGIDPYHEPIE